MIEFSCSFWLPFPPSVNRIWRYKNGKAYRSPQYVEWIKHADAAGQAQKLGRLPVFGRYSLQVQLSDAFKRFGDLDNRVKVIPDFCQHASIIVNDRNCVEASIKWDASIEHDCLVTLTGEIAYADQWEYARHKAEVARKRAKKGTAKRLALRW